MDVRSAQHIAPVVEHNGTVPVWWLVSPRELHEATRGGYLELVRKYCPSLTLKDLHDYPAGIRAQAVSKSGELINDFLFVTTRRALAVCNAPSPAATSAIPISRHIVEKVKALTKG